MKIKKIGHCCLLIETDNLTILTDPGAFSVGQDALTGIDAVLITHEHGDHLHIDSLKKVMANNPQAKVITNSGVGKQLDEAGIQYSILEAREQTEIKGVSLEAFDGEHEEIFEEIGQVQNTGYFIDAKLFYPGDSFKNPDRSVDVLALPVAGPWCRIADAIRYALSVKPQRAFPVHDGMLRADRGDAVHRISENVLTKNGIDFTRMSEGDEQEF